MHYHACIDPCSLGEIYMKFIISLVIFFLASSRSFSQVVPNISIDTLSSKLFPIYSEAIKNGIYDLPRDTTWKNLTKYESDAITIQAPATWLNLGALGSVVEVAFDGSGLYFSDTFNNKPVLVGAFLLNQAGTSLESARELALKDYRLNPDRSFENNYQDSVYNYSLQTGKKGYILHTHFFRKSNQLNQSRYDLILFSEKLNKAYSVMVSIQYSDPSYNFEKANLLNVFATKLFSHVDLK